MIRTGKILAAVMFALAFASPSMSFDYAWSDSSAFIVDTRVGAGKGDSGLFTLNTLGDIPTISQWGLGILGVTVLAAGTIVFRRLKRREPV